MKLYTLTPKAQIVEGIEVTHGHFRLGNSEGIETLIQMLNWQEEKIVKGAIPVGYNKMRETGVDVPIAGTRSGAVGLLMKNQAGYGERWEINTIFYTDRGGHVFPLLAKALYQGYCDHRGPEYFLVLEPRNWFSFKRLFTQPHTNDVRSLLYTVTLDASGELTVSESQSYGRDTGKAVDAFVDVAITQPSEPVDLQERLYRNGKK